MAAQIPPEDNSRPHAELGPELRQAVESVLHEDPPADWSDDMLDRLRQRSPRTAPRKSRPIVIWIALVAAACLIVFVMLNRSGVENGDRETANNDAESQDVPEPREVQPIVEDILPAPTLLAYQMAARQSPEALDALLDRHAGQLLRPSPESELADVMTELL